MRIEIRARGGGKTHDALKWMRAEIPGETRVMVCVHLQEVQRLRAQNEDIKPWRFVLFNELENLRGRAENIVLCVDNLDLLVSRIFAGFPVDFATATDFRIV